MANDGVLDYSLRNSNNYNKSYDQQPWREEIANDGVLDYSMRNSNNNNHQQPLQKKKRHQINRSLFFWMKVVNKFVHSNKTKSEMARENGVSESTQRYWIKVLWMYFTPMPIHQIIVYVKNKQMPDDLVYRPSKKNKLPRCSQKQQNQRRIKRSRSEEVFRSFSFGSDQNNQNLFDEQPGSLSEGNKLRRFSQKQQKQRGRKRSRSAAGFRSSSLDIDQNNQNLFDEQAGSSSEDTNLSQSSQQQQQWHGVKRFKSAEASLSLASTSGTSSLEPLLQQFNPSVYLDWANKDQWDSNVHVPWRIKRCKNFTRAERIEAIRRIRRGELVSEVASSMGVLVSTIIRWWNEEDYIRKPYLKSVILPPSPANSLASSPRSRSFSFDSDQNDQYFFDEQAGSLIVDTNLSHFDQQQQQWHGVKRDRPAEAPLSPASSIGIPSAESSLQQPDLPGYFNWLCQQQPQQQAMSMQLPPINANCCPPGAIRNVAFVESNFVQNRVTGEISKPSSVNEAINLGEKLLEWLNVSNHPTITSTKIHLVRDLITHLKSRQEEKKK